MPCASHRQTEDSVVQRRIATFAAVCFVLFPGILAGRPNLAFAADAVNNLVSPHDHALEPIKGNASATEKPGSTSIPIPALPDPSSTMFDMPDGSAMAAETDRGSVRAKIRPLHQAVLSAPLAATLIGLNALEGDSVKKGETLMEFDCAPAEAQLLVAQAHEQAANVKLDANKRLVKLHNVSEIDLKLSQVQLAVAQAELQGIRAQLSHCMVRAPFDGRVTRQLVQPHEFVREGDPVLRLVDTHNLEIEMVVSSSLVTKLHKGDKFSVDVDELSRSIEAKIKYVVSEVDPVSQTVRVIGVPVSPPDDLLPGMSGNVTFGFDARTTKDKSASIKAGAPAQ
jgi:RND family efflux transporter MFP subunit